MPERTWTAEETRKYYDTLPRADFRPSGDRSRYLAIFTVADAASSGSTTTP